MKKILIAFMVFSFLSVASNASKIEEKIIEVSGIGLNEQDAIDNALVRAVQQVNGQDINYKKESSLSSSVKSQNGVSERNLNEELSKKLSTQSKGFIKSWELISSRQYDEQSHKVEVRAVVNALKNPAHLNRTKIAVLQEGHISVDPVVQGKGKIILSIDLSGSMEPELPAVKQQLIKAIDASLASNLEVALMTWAGECDSPDLRSSGFTTDRNELVNMVNAMSAGGGTPLSNAVVAANNLDSSASVVLMSDGENGCKSTFANALNQIGNGTQISTIGFNIAAGSDAEKDLQAIASKTGGQYSLIVDASMLGTTFTSSVAKTPEAEKGTPYLAKKMTAMLVNSRKFAVMDRLNSVAIQSELSRAANSGNKDNHARLNQDVSPDYIVVLNTSEATDNSGRQLVDIEMNVIDYATTQIMFNRNEKVYLREQADSARGLRKIDLTLNKLYKQLIDKVAIPLVLSYSNGKAIIGQGSDYFRVGDTVSIERKGSMIIDPYTGDKLSAPLQAFAKGEVVNVTPTITEVKITQGSMKDISTDDYSMKQIVAKKLKKSLKQMKKEIKKKNEDFLNDI